MKLNVVSKLILTLVVALLLSPLSLLAHVQGKGERPKKEPILIIPKEKPPKEDKKPREDDKKKRPKD